jgi:hypothetical protein
LLSNNILAYSLFILDEESESSDVYIGRMLQILREFSEDPVLSSCAIDDIWDDMKAMKVYSIHTYLSLLFLIELSYVVVSFLLLLQLFCRIGNA